MKIQFSWESEIDLTLIETNHRREGWDLSPRPLRHALAGNQRGASQMGSDLVGYPIACPKFSLNFLTRFISSHKIRALFQN